MMIKKKIVVYQEKMKLKIIIIKKVKSLNFEKVKKNTTVF